MPWSEVQAVARGVEPTPGSLLRGGRIFAPLRLLAKSRWTPANARPSLPLLPVDVVEAELRTEAAAAASARTDSS